MAKQQTFLLILLLLITTSTRPVRADQEPFRVLLFSGEILLVDSAQRQVAVTVGQEISSNRFDRIELVSGSNLYLQRRGKLLHLNTAGTYKVSDIEGQTGSALSNALHFLASLSRPRSFTQQVKARGSQGESALEDPVFFNQIWESVAVNPDSSRMAVSPEDALATAAWFHQTGQPARTAYILESLDNTTSPRNPFYHQLRNDSLRGVPLAGINDEIRLTRLAAENRAGRFKYKALLIGIDQYDHPAWQPLDHPIADIRSIRDLLLDSYRFDPGDVITLENPTFSEIIEGFHSLKKTVDDQTRLIIYYAGHGYYPADEEEGYWVPRNGGDPATQRFFIPTGIILSKLKAIKSRHTLLITDSCFSGSLIRKSRGAAVESGFYRELSEKKSRQIITSGGLEPVSDSGGGSHSVFAGNLLNILSEDREIPLSASELAIELRKSLKNTGVPQTPEYGRLHTADDENGEFFFVRKNQSLAFTEHNRQAPVQTAEARSDQNGLEIIGMRGVSKKNVLAFQASDSENWAGIGVIFHQGFIEYNYLYSETGSSRKINISSSLQGSGLKAEYRRSNDKGGYGLIFDLGQFWRIQTCANNDSTLSELGIRTCDEEDRKDNQGQSSLSGYFTHLGIFADYSVLVWQEISVQLGGAVQLQHYKLNNFLEEDSLNSSTLGACGKSGVTYRNNRWVTRIFLDVCLATLEIGGSLHELNEDRASDVRILAGMNAGVSAGFEF